MIDGDDDEIEVITEKLTSQALSRSECLAMFDRIIKVWKSVGTSIRRTPDEYVCLLEGVLDSGEHATPLCIINAIMGLLFEYDYRLDRHVAAAENLQKSLDCYKAAMNSYKKAASIALKSANQSSSRLAMLEPSRN